MKRRDRALLLALLASLLSLAAVLLGPALMGFVFRPLGEGLWALARVLVLSVDQAKLWTFLIVVLALALAYRAARVLLDAPQGTGAETPGSDRNAALGSVEYWRYMFAETPRDDRERGLARRELARLLLSAYASKERVVNDFALYERFVSREIPLPSSVHDFLFAETRSEPQPGLRAWLRRASGRDRAGYRRSVEQYLEYLEAYMEVGDEG